jgi:hypothetical protein
LHLLQGYKPVEPRAYSPDGLAGSFVDRGVVAAGSVAAVNSRHVQRISIGMVDGTEDMADAKINEGR